MDVRTPGRLLALAGAALLAACGGGGGDSGGAVITGHAYKGPLHGASVCVYAVDVAAADRKGARVDAQPGSAPAVADGCVTTGSDGAYRIVLPNGTRGDLLVESSGGTYCTDESRYDGTSCAGGGTAVAMGAARLRTVVAAPESGEVEAPLTLLTTAATVAPASLAAASFEGAYGTIASAFGVPATPSTTPTSGALATELAELTSYVGTGIADFDEIVAGIASGALTGANTYFPAGVELVVGTDQDKVRVFTATSASAAQVSVAALPGIPGTYTRSGNTVTVTMPGHGLRNGFPVPLAFQAGDGGTATSGIHRVTVVDPDTFTVSDAASGTISGGKVLRDPVTRLSASYTQVAGNDYVTATIPAHGLQSGDYASVTVAGSSEAMLLEVDSVIDADTVRVSLPGPAETSVNGTAQVAIGSNYSIHDTVMHPSGKWLYVASAYDCGMGRPFCWGGDVITTYRIEWNRGRLVPVATTRTLPGSYSVPVKMVINPAGDRMVHQDDDLDGLVLSRIDPATGELTILANSGPGTASVHGLAFSADGQYLYNGAVPFTVTADAITRLPVYDSTGNATQIFGSTLFFVRPNFGLLSYDLADPRSPARLAELQTTADRDLASRDGSLFVASGRRGIKSFTYAGGTFTPVTGGELQRNGDNAMSDANSMYRSVHLNAAGNLAVATYFRTGQGGSTAQGQPSGYLFATVGADGKLARIADLPSGVYARSARFYKQP